MTQPGKLYPAPIPLMEPLTITLEGEVLKQLNEYREAAYRLSDKGWPEDAKAHNRPDRNRETYRPQRERATQQLLDFLCEQAESQQCAHTSD